MRTPIRETSFSLVFVTEAVIPVQIGMSTHKTTNFDSEKNEEGLSNNLHLLEERRDKVVLPTATYKQKMTEYYNSRVNLRRFVAEDLVLRKVSLATQDLTEERLRPN